MTQKQELKQRIISIHQKTPTLFKSKIGRIIKDEFKLDVSDEAARHIVKNVLRDFKQYGTTQVETNKVVGEFNWRKATKFLKSGQKLFKKASSNQDYATVKIDTEEPICVVCIGDLHMGSWATDYDLFTQVTDEIINTPNLFVILVGDLLQMSIKLRGVLEVSDNALPPKYQMMFLDSWLNEIKHKVICSTWSNHEVMREEVASGFSQAANIMSKYGIYHNHIGHLDLQVGNEVYNIAASHFFRGKSIENPNHGAMRYMRREGIDREICMAGDSHVPGMIKYTDGGKVRVAINSGTTQTNSGYGKRFFSLTTHPVFPCVVLSPESHQVSPMWSIAEWLDMKSL